MSYNCTHKVRTNQTETTYRIELSGGTGELVGTGDIFTLEYERIDPTQPYSVPLQSGRLEFSMLVRDSSDLALLQTIFTEAEGTRTLSLYQDNQLIFKGVVLSDLLEYPEADYPFEGKIIAKDLTALKGYNYTLNNDRKTIISVIAEILDILNYGYTIDAFTNWTQDNISDGSNFLGQIYMDSSSLREFRNQSENDTANADGSYDLPLNAYDALELILRNFGLILRQANGKWKIYQLSALTGDTVSGQSYTSAGVASGTLSESLTESIDKSTRYILPGSINTFNPALKKVGVNFNHRTRESETEIPRRITFSNTINQVLSPREYEFQFISETITSDSGRGTIYEDGPYITIKGSAKASVAPSASITSRDIFYFPIQVKIETLTKTYYLQDNDSWDTTVNTRYVRSTGRSAYGGKLHDNGTFDIESSITPDDADGILTVSIFQAQLTRPSKFPDSTPGQSTAQDFPNTFATSSSYDIEFEIVQTDDYSGSDSVQYEMTQDGNFSVEYDHGITYFGDGPQFFSPSALRYGTADKEVTNNDWGFVGGTKDQLLHELLLKEILFTQSETTRNLSAQLLGKFNPQNRLVFDSQKFFFLGGRLTGNNLWTANFLSLGFNTQTVNFSQIFASPSGELGAGVSTLYLANRSASFEEKQYITITSQSLTGTITSIPVVPTSIPVGKVGDPIYIFNIETGNVDEFTLSESYLIGATSFNVESGSVTGTAPEGSWIIYTGERISSYITQTDNAITLGVRSADVALLSDDSIFTNEAGDEYYFVEGDYTGQIIRSEALINIRADQILAQVSAIVGEDLTVLNDIVDDIAQLQTDVSQNDAAIGSLQTTVSGLPTAVEFAALEASLEINTDSILLGVREFSYALFSDNDEFITADGDTFAFVDNGDFIGLIRYNESLINVESDRIDLKVREIGAATAIGVLSTTRTGGLTYTQILLDDRTLAQDISLRDGDNLRLFNDAGQSEQVTVNGDQTLTKGNSSIQTITIDSKTLQNTYAAETSHLSFPGYQLGSEINVLKDEIVLKVDSNGDIAFIRLDGSADAGTEITINADQITVAGQTTFLSALGSEGFPTVSGINVTIRSATAPTIRTSGDALVTGDLWIETDNGDKPYTWNGTAWVPQYTVIDGGNIITGTITATQIASNTITATEIAAGTITATEIASDTITANEIASNTITATEIAANTITATEIAANTITASEIAAGTITATEIDVADLFSETITIGTGGYIQSTGYTVTSGFRINADGTANFQDVTIGGNSVIGEDAELDQLTITGRLTLNTGDLYAEGSSGNYVILNSDGITGVSNTLGEVFNLPSDGTAPTFSSGIINETIFQISTNAVLRTSSTALDGTASSAGVLINNTGIFGGEANQNTSTANVRIKTDGTAYIGSASNYIDFSSDTLTIATDTFTLETNNLDISSADETIEIGATTRVKLGKLSTTLFGISLNTDNYWQYDEDAGKYQFKVGTATNYIELDDTAFSIVADTFTLETTNLDISSTDETIEIGATTRLKMGKLSSTLFGLSLNTDNYWQYDEDAGKYQFKVGTATNYLELDGTAFSLKTDTFDLSTTGLTIDNTDGILITGSALFANLTGARKLAFEDSLNAEQFRMGHAGDVGMILESASGEDILFRSRTGASDAGGTLQFTIGQDIARSGQLLGLSMSKDGSNNLTVGMVAGDGSAAQTLYLLLKDLPVSSAGLATGTVWNDSGTLKIV